MKTLSKSGRYGVILLTCLAALLSGCASQNTRTVSSEVLVNRVYSSQVPPVVDYIWEEPMVDVIDVPPGLDPEEIYYRPAHQEVVEIRQGRFQYYRAPINR